MRKIVGLCACFLALAITGGILFMPKAYAVPASGNALPAPVQQEGESEGCLSCHDGIESIRPDDSAMMKDIKSKGECTVCHGGDPAITDDIEAAHTGSPASVPFSGFIPDPGSMTVANQTCGQCHEDYAHTLERSLMNTEAGKIQGNLWSWGVAEDQAVRYGNYHVEDSKLVFGSFAYKEYMRKLAAAYPDQFPDSLEMLPNPSVEEIVADPKLAAFTYQRQQCQRCHVGVKGRSARGDYRGMGCSSCHIPYSVEGLYEGDDPTIPKDEPGHMLVHEIQGSREARNGIPTETCVACHNRGKRIGTSYQGIMEFPYGTPYFEDGTKQDGDRRLHTKRYLYIKEDLHHERQSRPENPEGGLLCQDCHTTIEMHGDGTIPGTTLAQVEIECADCHGTPSSYPWELPLGYGEEFAGLEDMPTEPRGLGGLLDLSSQDGTLYEMEEGYLLTARGNSFGNVVLTDENKVIVHSATGKDFSAPLLKAIAEEGSWSSPDGHVAMEQVSAHMEKLECYACHADWAPQCYGCHVNVNFSVDSEGNARMDTDWVSSGNAALPDGSHEILKSPGKVSESRSYLRWEAPILGVNGEGRVTPLIPGCEVIFTVIGPEGKTLLYNEIGRTPPGTEGGGDEGQRGLDMAPVQPHTAGRKARTCESCHSDPKALGYGIEGGRFMLGYTEERFVDLEDAEGNIIPKNSRPQIAAISDLPMDLSQIVNPDTGEQMMTVGSHWPDSGPLSEEQRTRAERTGVCMGCHQNMADEAFWTDQVIATFGQAISNDDHIEAMNAVIRASVGVSETLAPQGAASEKESQAVALASGKEASTEVNAGASEEAEVRIIDAEAKAAEAAARASEAESKAAEAESLAEEVQKKLAESEAALAESQAGEAVQPVTASISMWVVIALILGLVTGSGAVFFGKQ